VTNIATNISERTSAGTVNGLFHSTFRTL